MDNIIGYLQEILKGAGYIGMIYLIPYLIRRGWGDGANKTRKVCDTCFRDIEKINKIVEDHKMKNGGQL